MPILGTLASGGLAPGAPTIGTASDGGTGSTATVAFTAPAWVGKGTGTVTYTATSSPGNITGTSTSSPITVSGLTTGTAYTFTVTATTSYGITGPASAASNSVTPANPSAFDSIATVTVGSATGTITFTSIPNTYTSLQLRCYTRSDSGGTNDLRNLLISPNQTNNIGYYHFMLANGTAWSATASSTTKLFVKNAVMSSGDNHFGAALIDISNYADSGKYKTIKYLSGGCRGTNDTTYAVQSGSAEWDDLAVISRLDITIDGGQNFAPGSQIALYGIKG